MYIQQATPFWLLESGKPAGFNFQPAFSDDTHDFVKYEFPHALAGKPAFSSDNDINCPTGCLPEREFCKSQDNKSTESPDASAHEQVIRDRIQHIAMDTILITHGHRREDFSRLTNDEEDTPEDYKYYKEYAEYCRNLDLGQKIDYTTAIDDSRIYNYFKNRKPSSPLKRSDADSSVKTHNLKSVINTIVASKSARSEDMDGAANTGHIFSLDSERRARNDNTGDEKKKQMRRKNLGGISYT